MSMRLFVNRVLASLMVVASVFITAFTMLWCLVHIVVLVAGLIARLPEMLSKAVGEGLIKAVQWMMPMSDFLWRDK